MKFIKLLQILVDAKDATQVILNETVFLVDLSLKFHKENFLYYYFLVKSEHLLILNFSY